MTEPAMPLWSVAPFAILLLGIAILPLVVPHWWEKNSNKAIFATLVALPAVIFLAIAHAHLLPHAALEYFSFIVLLGSLYVISGGVVVRGDIKPSPLVNAGFLGAGSILASIVGTTGASMLLIRPFLRANQIRDTTRHLPIFFIFTVSNAGGLLTPLGDPPLFLGFLRGVPFTWTFSLAPVWLFVNGVIIGVFAFLDWRAFRAEGAVADFERRPVSIGGLLNIVLLLSVVASAAALPFIWREAAMIGAAVVSLLSSKKELRKENGFTYHPIEEVAILFAAIFATMQPALELLREEGPKLGVDAPLEFFWASGVLSSFLDNAPTYLTFFTVAQTITIPGAATVAATSVAEPLLVAISLGSVLMGANTYIGNGPNFMVKSISDEAGFKTPSFFGYMAWSVGILVPLWAVVGWIFVS
jgi:Na+/H+ antiporter NhaD/arsenite permease-like protein